MGSYYLFTNPKMLKWFHAYCKMYVEFAKSSEEKFGNFSTKWLNKDYPWHEWQKYLTDPMEKSLTASNPFSSKSVGVLFSTSAGIRMLMVMIDSLKDEVHDGFDWKGELGLKVDEAVVAEFVGVNYEAQVSFRPYV